MKNFKGISKSLIWMLMSITMLSSCYSTKTQVLTVNDFPAFRNQCIGQTHNQIVAKLGAPQRTESDGNGGRILIYENTTTTSVSNSLATAYNVNYFNRTYTPGVSTTTQQTKKTDYVQYFVNAQNVCYDVKTNIPMTHQEKGDQYRKFSWLKTLGLVGISVLGTEGILLTVLSIL